MLSNNFFFEWVDDAERKQAEYNTIAGSPAALAVVRTRLKGGSGRTPNMRFMCRGHHTGLSAALSIDGSKVRLDIVGPAELIEQTRPNDDTPWRGLSYMAVTGLEDVAPVTITCAECGTATSHNAVWVLKESLRRLASMTAEKTTRLEITWTRT